MVKQEFNNLISEKPVYHSKVSIIGTASVGMACAFCILLKGLSDELALVDVNEDELKWETMDLHHAALSWKGQMLSAAKMILSLKIPA